MEKMIAIHTVTEQALLVHCFGQNPQNLTQKDVKPDSRAPGTGYLLFPLFLSCFILAWGRSLELSQSTKGAGQTSLESENPPSNAQRGSRGGTRSLGGGPAASAIHAVLTSQN